jgi:hypothetical protein
MAAKKNAAAMKHIVASLKRNPNISYADVRAGAQRKSLTVYPIMYGRAKALLGLVKVSPRGSKKKAKLGKRGPGRPPKLGKRGPGRPRKTSDPLDALQAMVADYRNTERELARLRQALASIRDLCDRSM